MRWFRRGLGKGSVQQDPGRLQLLLDDVRQGFGAHVQADFAAQAAEVARRLEGDDGLAVAAEILREFADAAYAEMLAQAADLQRRTGYRVLVDRRNYRPLWQDAGRQLRWSLFVLPGGLHPYVQVAAAAKVIGLQARRVVRVVSPEPVLAHLFEVLDLTLDGWEYGRVLVDADAAALAEQLIATARDLCAAMSDPPPLPPPVREMMRRNHTVDVRDATGTRVLGSFNPGKTMREYLLA